jgi:hypothetical protein
MSKRKPRSGTTPADTERARNFVRELLAGKPAQEAAKAAGYSAKATGALMRRLDVQTAIRDENRARNRVLRHTPAQIEAQLGNLAFSDIGALFRPDMSLKSLDEIAPEDRAAVSSIDTQEICDREGRVIRRIHRIRLEKKQPPLETLGKIRGLITDQPIDASQGIQYFLHLDKGAPPLVLTLGGSVPQVEEPAIDVTPALPPPRKSDPDPTLN